MDIISATHSYEESLFFYYISSQTASNDVCLINVVFELTLSFSHLFLLFPTFIDIIYNDMIDRHTKTMLSSNAFVAPNIHHKKPQ